MTSQIDLTDKTERDILVLLVERVHAINERLDRQNGNITDQAACIRSLENWRYLIVGGLSMLSLVVVIGVPMLIKYWAG